MTGIKSILFMLSLIIFTSCKEEIQEYAAVRRIINETLYDVQIKLSDNSEEYQYALNKNDTINLSGACFSGFENYCDIGWLNENLRARLIFDNEKILTIDPDTEQIDQKLIQAADPSRGYGYTKSMENGIRVYTYRITQEDYDSAEPIE